MGGDSELPHSVVRGIGDKLYEKRKCAALEVEQLVKSLAAAGNTKRVGQIIDKLIEDFAFSPQANYRKGGLLCLAATAVGLANNNQEFLQRIVPPVLNSFTGENDTQSRTLAALHPLTFCLWLQTRTAEYATMPVRHCTILQKLQGRAS